MPRGRDHTMDFESMRATIEKVCLLVHILPNSHWSGDLTRFSGNVLNNWADLTLAKQSLMWCSAVLFCFWLCRVECYLSIIKLNAYQVECYLSMVVECGMPIMRIFLSSSSFLVLFGCQIVASVVLICLIQPMQTVDSDLFLFCSGLPSSFYLWIFWYCGTIASIWSWPFSSGHRRILARGGDRL